MEVGPVEGPAHSGMSWLIVSNARLFVSIALRKNRGCVAGRKQKESEPLTKRKGNLSHSAVYGALNLQEVRPKRCTLKLVRILCPMGFGDSGEMTPLHMTLQDILQRASR